jgi:hypothetical protein
MKVIMILRNIEGLNVQERRSATRRVEDTYDHEMSAVLLNLTRINWLEFAKYLEV